MRTESGSCGGSPPTGIWLLNLELQHDRNRRAAGLRSRLEKISASGNSPYPGVLGRQFRRKMAGSLYRLLYRVVDAMEYHVPLPPMKFRVVDGTVLSKVVPLDKPCQ